MTNLEIKKMLKCRHPQILINYSKIRIIQSISYYNNVGIVKDNEMSIRYTIMYNNTKYNCYDSPTGKFSGKRIYTIEIVKDCEVSIQCQE